ncbi:MAG: hypothetical protein IJA10_09365 [Lachnospiraceae bacterium]|nr:hypothetical protein [Lachnospiraceae bacterium]
MKRNHIEYVITIVGALLLVSGLCLTKMTDVSEGIMATLPYICIGLGCVIFGYGVGEICTRKAEKAAPELAKQISIENNDERNVAISNKAKAKAYDMMVFIFAALQISFGLMGIGLSAILMLNVAYLLVIGCGIYYRKKFDKEM